MLTKCHSACHRIMVQNRKLHENSAVAFLGYFSSFFIATTTQPGSNVHGASLQQHQFSSVPMVVSATKATFKGFFIQIFQLQWQAWFLCIIGAIISQLPTLHAGLSYVSSFCPHKIIFVSDKMKIVLDKIFLVPDQTFYSRLKSSCLVGNSIENDFLAVEIFFSMAKKSFPNEAIYKRVEWENWG